MKGSIFQKFMFKYSKINFLIAVSLSSFANREIRRHDILNMDAAQRERDIKYKFIANIEFIDNHSHAIHTKI